MSVPAFCCSKCEVFTPSARVTVWRLERGEAGQGSGAAHQQAAKGEGERCREPDDLDSPFAELRRRGRFSPLNSISREAFGEVPAVAPFSVD